MTIFLAVVLDIYIGVLVLTAIDDDNFSVWKWLNHKHEPYPSEAFALFHKVVLFPLALILWPLVAWMFIRRRKG